MRPILAGALSLLILGLVQGFMLFQQHVTEQYEPFSSAAELDVMENNFVVVVSLGFNAAPEPFQLYPAALTIRREGLGETVARCESPLRPGQAVEVPVRPGSLKSGTNALTITAWLPGEVPAVERESSGALQDETRMIELTWLQDGVEIARQRLNAVGGRGFVVAKCDLELP